MEHPYIPPETCMTCHEGAPVHQDWHPTRADLLAIGKELTARVRAREDRAVSTLPDDELVAYGQRMRRLLVTARDDGWPGEFVALVEEWVAGAAKEWRWRQRAARLGADGVARLAGTWADRVDRLKRGVDLALLIGLEGGGITGRHPKLRCCCTFHLDHDPSLDIDTDKGVWFCRVCQIGGDAIRYAELRYGLTFAEAVGYLEERCGFLPPERRIDGVAIIRADGAA